MNVAIFNYYEKYNKNNALFDSASYPIGEDLAYPSCLLRNKLNQMNINLNTMDQYLIDDIDKVIFLDFPTYNKKLLKTLKAKNIPMYLIINECEIIKPDNWDKKNHNYFNKIFTWKESLVDNKKYFKFYWPNKINKNIIVKQKEKLCTMIAGNKINNDKRELYSARADIVEWFEKNHLNEFDLYGIGWEIKQKHGHSFYDNLYRFISKRIIKYRNFLKSFKNINVSPYKSYKGQIENKKDILSSYKFSICYENAQNIPGYITEKIFDCFFSGCVPVYWGAPNITDLIPEDCFIDNRNFNSHEELYYYMKNMSLADYNGYIERIEKFINSQKIYPFSAECFVETIIRELSQ